MVSKKVLDNRYRASISYVYCMYCCKPFRMQDLAIKEGRHDVCKGESCLKAYKKERAITLERSKKQQRRDSLGENNDDPTWMNGGE